MPSMVLETIYTEKNKMQFVSSGYLISVEIVSKLAVVHVELCF